MNDEYIEKLKSELETFNNDVLISISSLCCGIIKLRREQDDFERTIKQLKKEMKNERK